MNTTKLLLIITSLTAGLTNIAESMQLPQRPNSRRILNDFDQTPPWEKLPEIPRAGGKRTGYALKEPSRSNPFLPRTYTRDHSKKDLSNVLRIKLFKELSQNTFIKLTRVFVDITSNYFFDVTIDINIPVPKDIDSQNLQSLILRNLRTKTQSVIADFLNELSNNCLEYKAHWSINHQITKG